MIKMLKLEEELRVSERYQKKFADPDENAIHVAAEAQEEVLRTFGVQDSELEDMLGVLRAAPALYPEHKEEICRIPHYRKFNRSARGQTLVFFKYLLIQAY